jgi:hypothetical protein
MNFSDIPTYITAAGIIGGALASVALFIGQGIKKTTKAGSAILTDLATEGVKKVTEGVAILTTINLKVDNIEHKMHEVKTEMGEVQAFMNSSQRDRTELHVRVGDLERRLTTLEGRDRTTNTIREFS